MSARFVTTSLVTKHAGIAARFVTLVTKCAIVTKCATTKIIHWQWCTSMSKPTNHLPNTVSMGNAAHGDMHKQTSQLPNTCLHAYII